MENIEIDYKEIRADEARVMARKNITEDTNVEMKKIMKSINEYISHGNFSCEFNEISDSCKELLRELGYRLNHISDSSMQRVVIKVSW